MKNPLIVMKPMDDRRNWTATITITVDLSEVPDSMVPKFFMKLANEVLGPGLVSGWLKKHPTKATH